MKKKSKKASRTEVIEEQRKEHIGYINTRYSNHDHVEMILHRPITEGRLELEKQVKDIIAFDILYRQKKLEEIANNLALRLQNKDDEMIRVTLNELHVAVHIKWIDSHYDQLPVISENNRLRLNEGRVACLFEHFIFILHQDIPEESLRYKLDFISLCSLMLWHEQAGVDIIVYRNVYRRFLTLYIGMQQIECLRKHPFFQKPHFQPLLTGQDVKAHSTEFNVIRLPTIDEYQFMFQHTKLYPYWYQVE